MRGRSKKRLVVATDVSPWLRFAKHPLPASSRRQLRFMVPLRPAEIVEAFHELARSYACEGVKTVRETCFARRLTRLRRATTGQAPAATVQGLIAPTGSRGGRS